MPEFYTTFVRKMPEFYIVCPKKIFFRDFGGVVGKGNPLAPGLLRLWLGPRPPPAKSGPGWFWVAVGLMGLSLLVWVAC